MHEGLINLKNHCSYGEGSNPIQFLVYQALVQLVTAKNSSILVKLESFVGDLSGGGTPGPIPNPAVKPASADGSMWFLHARVGHCQQNFLFYNLTQSN